MQTQRAKANRSEANSPSCKREKQTAGPHRGASKMGKLKASLGRSVRNALASVDWLQVNHYVDRF